MEYISNFYRDDFLHTFVHIGSRTLTWVLYSIHVDRKGSAPLMGVLLLPPTINRSISRPYWASFCPYRDYVGFHFGLSNLSPYYIALRSKKAEREDSHIFVLIMASNLVDCLPNVLFLSAIFSKIWKKRWYSRMHQTISLNPDHINV